MYVGTIKADFNCDQRLQYKENFVNKKAILFVFERLKTFYSFQIELSNFGCCYCLFLATWIKVSKLHASSAQPKTTSADLCAHSFKAEKYASFRI